MRRLTVLVVVAAACGGSQAGPGVSPEPDATPSLVRFAPATMRYRLRQHRHVEQEFNGQVTANDAVTTLILASELAPGADALTATFIVDSLTVTGSATFSQAQIQAAVGTRFTGTLLPDGKLEGFVPSDSTQPFVQQLTVGLEEFYPRIPADGVAPGQAWSDTTETTFKTGDLNLEIESANHYRSADWTEYAGQPALAIHTVADFVITGTGQQAGQDLSLDGTGRRHMTQFMTRDGRYLGAISADTTNLDVFVEAAQIVVPVTQISTDTVAVVP